MPIPPPRRAAARPHPIFKSPKRNSNLNELPWATVAIGVGLVVSLLFTEAYGLTVGGMIVPGYMALYIQTPMTIVATIAAALLTLLVVRQISRFAIVYGRRRVVITMLVGFLLGELLRQFLTPASNWFLSGDRLNTPGAAADYGITVIGFVIPGLIALWMDRTSILQTLSPLTAATAVVHLVLIAMGLSL